LATQITGSITTGGPLERLPYPGEAGQRNNFRRDGYFGADASLTKPFKITESQLVKFGLEIFNLSTRAIQCSVRQSDERNVWQLQLNSPQPPDACSSRFGTASSPSSSPSLVLQSVSVEFTESYSPLTNLLVGKGWTVLVTNTRGGQ